MDAINPNLHRLYVLWAMQHLRALKKTLKTLSKQTGFHAAESVDIIFKERKRLLETNAAYQEAAWRLMAGHCVVTTDAGDILVDKYTDTVIPCDDISSPVSDQKDEATVETLLIERTKKSRTNNLTLEQRRENGRKGAAKREDSRRRVRARNAGKYHLYGITNAYGLLPEKYTLMGSPFGNMRSAFRHLTHNLNSYDGFVVYDNKGHRWNYDPEVHNLTKLNP